MPAGQSVCGYPSFRSTNGLGFHFDKDEAALVDEGAMRHPILSSVLYLSGSAAGA